MNSLQNSLRKSAFTLAEVLITLGIIGVVAAITIPTMMSTTSSKELQSAFKKVYAELNQISLMFLNDNEMSLSEYAAQKGQEQAIRKFSSYYKGDIQLTNTGQGTNDGEGNYIAYYDIHTLNGEKFSGGTNHFGKTSSFLCDNTGFRTNMNGIVYLFNDPPTSGVNGPVVCVDVNGKKPPNRYGVDYFMFIFTVDGRVIPMGMSHPNNFPSACKTAHGGCNNFSNVGAQYCDKNSTNITRNASCAYYALTDTHPTESGKTYWKDFIREVYNK